MYHFTILPPKIFSHNIGFAGMIAAISTPRITQTQALRQTTYLTKQLPIPGTQREIRVKPSFILNIVNGDIHEGTVMDFPTSCSTRCRIWTCSCGISGWNHTESKVGERNGLSHMALRILETWLGNGELNGLELRWR
jgi:hypothetical protein